jgi:hypothetical protein
MKGLRVLVTVDFHGNANAEIYLARFLELGYDCALVIGDLTDFGPLGVAESIFERVKEFGIPILSVPGNCDPKQVLQVLERYGANLHENCKTVSGVTFVGLGGSNVTPFKTPFELTEVEIQENLAAITPTTKDDWVLVTHVPPHKTKLDEVEAGMHVGSKSLRQYVELNQPTVLVCGHVHEARGIDRLGRTIMVNPGPISKGFAACMKIGDKREPKIELLQA